MKKTNKIIAVILAMVLAFSSVPLMASAAAIKDDVDTVEKLIQGESLGNLVEWLLKNINNRKEEILGSVLSLVFLLVEDEALQAKVGETDVLAADDEALAKILVDWLNADILPGLQADLASDDTVKSILKIVNIDVGSVDKIISSLYALATTVGLGDISNLKEESLIFEKKGLRVNLVTVKNSGNLGALYSVLQFLSDNTDLFKKVLSGKVNLGLLAAVNGLINDLIKDYISPDAIKKMLCDAIELDYEAYKNYTADQILAAAFLKLLTGSNEKIDQKAADDVMQLSIYGFLETYAGDIYANLLLDLLNNDARTALKDLAAKDTTGKLSQVINLEYEFKADTFDEYLGVGKGNMIAQLNNLIITVLKLVIQPAEFAKLGLEEGGNDKLNSNLTKTFRYLLPLIKDLPDLGVDLSKFTADAVKNMSAEEMAVAVLKLFFQGWFKNADMKEVDKAKTLEQLAVLAAKFAASNKEWVPMDIVAVKKAVNVEKMDEAACLDLVFEIGMEVAAKALNYNKGTTYYELPEDTSKWTGEDYLDDIVDWALNFVDGLPASADILSTERGVIDGEGGFFKLNVILDSLFDTSFISGCGNDTFALDFETMLMDKFLGNLLNFDIEASVAMLAENEEASLFDKKINVAVIDLVDDLLTGLFEEGYEIPAAYKLGDVDSNDKVDATDARLALRAAVGLDKLDASQEKAADVDKNAKVDATDARLILRVAVGLDKLA
ncbi:MAG: dockerin type I repeat-containing protein [Clostridia bacterium]|nr:dockerin type I repeat-containing protein [Clostridia bacterium]